MVDNMTTTSISFDVYFHTLSGDIDNLQSALIQFEDNLVEWYVDENGLTAMHHAVTRGSVDCILILLNHGCDINIATTLGLTPLFIACAMGLLSVVELLLDRGADVGSSISISGETSLHIASKHNRVEIVRMLSQRGADVDSRNNDGLTPLHVAILHGTVQCLEALIVLGADINSEDIINICPLQMAAFSGQAQCCSVLLKHDAEINHNLDLYAPPVIEEGILADCRPIIEKERKRRGKLLKKTIFDSFASHHIEYQPYKDHISKTCYPLGHSNHRMPKGGWIKSNLLLRKYYFDEIFFALHLHVAQVCTKSIEKSNTVIVASKCTLASECNKTSTLMVVLSSYLKEFLKPQNSCAVCNKECNKECSRCRGAYYCSESHQLADWPLHKLICKPISNKLQNNITVVI